MRRRAFLLVLGAFLACPKQSEAAKSRKLLTIDKDCSNWYVAGRTEDVLEFMCLYQDSLWPDWRSHWNPAARNLMRENAVSLEKQGGVHLWTGQRVWRRAGDYAINRWLELGGEISVNYVNKAYWPGVSWEKDVA